MFIKGILEQLTNQISFGYFSVDGKRDHLRDSTHIYVNLNITTSLQLKTVCGNVEQTVQGLFEKQTIGFPCFVHSRNEMSDDMMFPDFPNVTTNMLQQLFFFINI